MFVRCFACIAFPLIYNHIARRADWATQGWTTSQQPGDRGGLFDRSLPYLIMPRQLWTAADDARLGTASDADVAKQLGRSRQAVQVRRRRCKIPAFGGLIPAPYIGGYAWGNTDLGMLGRYPDEYVAQITGRS